MAKRGVAMYKEIKATAGDVSGVLKDLKEQFHKIVDPSPEQKHQYNEEVRRVQKIAEAKPDEVLNDIWDNLGVFVDQYDVMVKAYTESEISAKSVYKGDKSLGRRALERLKLKYQLDSMLAEVREQMVYHAPSELGDLWTRFEQMWTQIVVEQNQAIAEEMRKAQILQWRRRKAIQKVKALAAWIGAILFVLLWMMWVGVLIRKSQTYQELSSFVSQSWP
jgi:hypothetical protein